MAHDWCFARRGRFEGVRSPFGQCVPKFAKWRFEHWQACAYDPKQCFQSGQERDAAVRFLRVQVCWVADRGGQLDAVDCDGADPAMRKGVSISIVGSTRIWQVEEPYRIPIPKMQLNATFLLFTICNLHSIGMGKATTATSCSRLKMAMYMSSIF